MNFSPEVLVLYGFFFFCGLFYGWFFRKQITIFRVILILIVTSVIAPVIEFLMIADYMPITVSFVAGFLIHTWKPIYRAVSGN